MPNNRVLDVIDIPVRPHACNMSCHVYLLLYLCLHATNNNNDCFRIKMSFYKIALLLQVL